MSNIHPGVDPTAALGAAALLTRPAEEFVNDPEIEVQWALKAVEHMEVYQNLLKSVPGSMLKLTPHDDKLYECVKRRFPDMKFDVIDETELKSEESRVKWREFCMEYKDIVEDYNFGTMLRLDCNKEYSEENTTLVPRVQFYAIEVVRNREGINDCLNKS